MHQTPWIGVPSKIREYAGFIYQITNLISGKRYVGRKYFFHTHAKKQKKPTGRVAVKVFESNWKAYTSSSRNVNHDIRALGAENFRFEILECLKSRRALIEREVDLMLELDVMNARLQDGEYAFYNETINAKTYRPKRRGSEAYNKKCANISEALLKLTQSPDYVHPLQGKIHPNRGKKLPQTRPKTSIEGWLRYTDGSKNIMLRPDAEVPVGFRRGATRFTQYPPHASRVKYAQNPKACVVCGTTISFKKKLNDVCGRTCAGIQHRGHTRSKGKLNAQWAGWVRTPLGIFETMKQAADAHGISSTGMAYRLQSAWPAMRDFIGPLKTEDGNIPKEWLQ